ncbi:MAG TPA: hypothetical protein VJ822_05800 [Dongiaceae bacterium]|nr:hypothetical protein [Dongiaceae bacterium]
MIIVAMAPTIAPVMPGLVHVGICIGELPVWAAAGPLLRSSECALNEQKDTAIQPQMALWAAIFRSVGIAKQVVRSTCSSGLSASFGGWLGWGGGFGGTSGRDRDDGLGQGLGMRASMNGANGLLLLACLIEWQSVIANCGGTVHGAPDLACSWR